MMSWEPSYPSKPLLRLEHPAEISEILTCMIGEAPRFVDRYDPRVTIESRFEQVEKGIDYLREPFGAEGHAQMLGLLAQAKAYFLSDPEETNGNTMKGIQVIHAMSDLLEKIWPSRETLVALFGDHGYGDD